MHNMPIDAADAFMVSKAARIAENSEALRLAKSTPTAPPNSHPLAKRRYAREDLLRIGEEIKRQCTHGNDAMLKSFGFSIAGIAYFFETRMGEAPERANLLAHALESLWTSRNER